MDSHIRGKLQNLENICKEVIENTKSSSFIACSVTVYNRHLKPRGIKEKNKVRYSDSQQKEGAKVSG